VISLAWSPSPFVKLRLYPLVPSDPNTESGAEAAVDGQDPTIGSTAISQAETSESEVQDDHPSSHNIHMRPEVRKLRDEPTNYISPANRYAE
jgi:hypothetical protein